MNKDKIADMIMEIIDNCQVGKLVNLEESRKLHELNEEICMEILSEACEE